MIDARAATGHRPSPSTAPRPTTPSTRPPCAELTGILDRLVHRRHPARIVLTGTGRSFCAGAALGDVAGSDWSDNPLTRLCDTLEAFPCPTIAALNGGVYGGGVEVALACDFRVGVIGMKAFVPPARLGIHYEPAGIEAGNRPPRHADGPADVPARRALRRPNARWRYGLSRPARGPPKSWKHSAGRWPTTSPVLLAPSRCAA